MAKGDRIYKQALKLAEFRENGVGEDIFDLLSKSAALGNPQALYALATLNCGFETQKMESKL